MRLDGNAAAGALQQVFPFELTQVRVTCAACHARAEIGSSFAYMNAPGVVVRCRSCEGVLLRFAQSDSRIWIELSGCASLELEAAA